MLNKQYLNKCEWEWSQVEIQKWQGMVIGWIVLFLIFQRFFGWINLRITPARSEVRIQKDTFSRSRD